MTREVRHRLLDARSHAVAALDAGRGLDEQRLTADRRTWVVVLHNIMIVGEAVKYIPLEVLALAPEIPWRSIARLRDMIVHRYWQIAPPPVVRVVNSDLGELIQALDKILAMLDEAP